MVAFHFARYALAEIPLVGRVVGAGHVAVDFFFVLSGFVLAHRYQASPPNDGKARRTFWWRRVARLYPLYLVSLAMGFVAALPDSWRGLEEAQAQLHLAMQAAALNAWWHKTMFQFNWAAWSLSVEAFFYLLFPWLFAALAHVRARWIGVALACCWVAMLVPPAVYSFLNPDHLSHALRVGDEVKVSWYLKFFPLLRLPEFIAGILASRIRPPPSWQTPRGSLFLTVLAIGVGGGALVTGAVPYAYLQGGALLPLSIAVVVLLANADNVLTRFFSARPWTTLGHASYATYILHVPFYLLLAKHDPLMWSHPNRTLPYFVLMPFVSLFAYFAFEEPLRRALTRVTVKTSPP